MSDPAHRAYFEKLIRDAIPGLSVRDGSGPPVRTAARDGLALLFVRKLIEESTEVGEAMALGDAKRLAEELADLRTVIDDRQVVIVLAIAMTLVGIYSINTKVFDVFVAIGAGGVGYFMLRYGYSPAAAALGVFIGKEFERSLRIGLNMNDNSFVTFLV